MKKRQTKKLVKSAKRTAPARKPAKAARPAAKASPAGPPSVTPQLVVKGADRAMDFYKRAFGARERMRMPGPDGKTVMHAELTIGSSTVHMSDEFPDMGPGPRSPETLHGTTGTLHLAVPDVDAAFKRAVEAGAQVRMAPADMFWGDRYAKVSDPFGHEWGMSTPREKLTPQQMKTRAQDFFSQMAKPK